MTIKRYCLNNLRYAESYILLQKYKNLFHPDEALMLGTLFKDLYRPYVETE